MLTSRPENRRSWREVAVTVALREIQTLPFVIGGAALTAGSAGGVQQIAGGVIAIFVFSTFNAWILLEEILR